MNASVFFDAFAECLVGVAFARKHPAFFDVMKSTTTIRIALRHGDVAGEATGRMFDKLWSEAQGPKERP